MTYQIKVQVIWLSFWMNTLEIYYKTIGLMKMAIDAMIFSITKHFSEFTMSLSILQYMMMSNFTLVREEVNVANVL